MLFSWLHGLVLRAHHPSDHHGLHEALRPRFPPARSLSGQAIPQRLTRGHPRLLPRAAWAPLPVTAPALLVAWGSRPHHPGFPKQTQDLVEKLLLLRSPLSEVDSWPPAESPSQSVCPSLHQHDHLKHGSGWGKQQPGSQPGKTTGPWLLVTHRQLQASFKVLQAHQSPAPPTYATSLPLRSPRPSRLQSRKQFGLISKWQNTKKGS